MRRLPFTYREGNVVNREPFRGDWMDEAKCNVDSAEDDVWFSGDGQERTQETAAREAQAIAVCRTCPVRVRCLEVGASEPYGVWGGIGQAERRKLYDLGVIHRGAGETRPRGPRLDKTREPMLWG